MERGHVHPEHGAHPRSRGEHAATLFSVGSRSGSSPLARGTPGVDAACLVIVGLIPARAGNTNFLEIPAASPWAHPRSRGEHIHDDRRRINSLGSSPLARGTRQSGAGKLTRRGLIPARAGNTGRVAVTGGVRRAHPRSRGEHRLSAHLYFDLPGSSPLARGTLTGGAPAICRVGLIPARAGNTCFRLSVRLASRAHPRSRGEHLKIWSGPPVVRGSSPLARGTHVLVHEGRGRVGLIPARAGNMEEPPPTPPVKWAHPRSRGEHRSHQNRGCRPTGSSPLARGTPFCPVLGEVFPGLIPARAGNTWLLARVLAACRAHPRSRGEHRGLTS